MYFDYCGARRITLSDQLFITNCTAEQNVLQKLFRASLRSTIINEFKNASA